MNQQQLQNARTALWRQNGQPLLTLDDAAAWLDETGVCLFLPRHAQLPAPAPSFVEGCAGEARAVPAPAAIEAAMALVVRLVAEKRAVPLNLMGSLTEQPDFLATPETLRWIAAVRGDRNWKDAPGGRAAPLVQRVWSALDQGPGRTAIEIREELGRELTEAAVLRALVELWTTLRAAPEYAGGEPTRWSLMRDRYPKEMAAGANTAQTTALSALISLYLRQAVAATSEEAEIFLSPLTARSRIREVLHGMLATRQFGTMPMGVQTLLYLEGTLPEFPEAEAPAPSAEAKSDRGEREGTPQRKPWTPSPREGRPGFRREPPPAAGPGPRREFRRESARPLARGPKRDERPERRQGPERGPRPGFREGQKRPFRAGQKPQWRPKFGGKPGGGPENRREFGKPGRKPWEKRGDVRGPRPQREQGREFGAPSEGKRDLRRGRKEGGWRAPRRPEREIRAREEGRPGQREIRPERQRELRPDSRQPGGKRPDFRRGREGAGEGRGAFRREGQGRPKFGKKPGRPGGGERPPGRFGEREGKRFARPGGRFGKPGGGSGKPGRRFGKPGGGRFGKPGAKGGSGEGIRKNKGSRPGARSGKNRKEQKDQPE